MTALLAFFAGNWRWLVPLVLIGGLGVDDGLHRLWLAQCELAREQDKTAAEKAKSAALEDAQKRSDAIITEQAQALAQTAAKAGGIIERIVHVPVTTACAASPAMRAASDGLRELFRGPAGGGDPQAGGGAAPAVPGSRAGR